MATITAAQVKELRDATAVSMMDCKKALQETDGNMEEATRLLRERGIATAAKRATKATNQGIIASDKSDDGKTVGLVEVNCETDFVSRNDDFKAFVTAMATQAVTTDEPLSEVCADELTDKIASIGENLKIRRNVRFTLQGTGAIGDYIHMGGKVGVLVELGCEKDESTAAPAYQELLRDLTLHVAACNPGYLVADDVPADEVEAERAIFAKQVEGKPEQIIDKIVDGKLRKFFGEICLMEQGFVKEPKQSISDLLAETGKALEDTFTIRRYARYQLGA
ncbi:MAG: translation elongation factor Ts [Kiritimatiellia bacterium]|jgi:elongation factor Ts|nr:translation elongation factor Ts [Kiritimatiellia bacterium]MDP6629596.1 translation elongation factor Ts [Kiritimatiellia bacterium]MDP6809303.1 translation elongation factor Ts [Kiritimatiellia bacterium]MDP7023041.1 translation elongation factor Ts [Kiritimatiellia bacterium]